MNRYITTTLPYVNGDIHIGNALEFVQADALARLWRLRGDDVFFSTGTDEHGQKIFEAAEKEDKPVQDYVDYYAKRVQHIKKLLDLSYDHFIRTTDKQHLDAAQAMWNLCDAAGDIYKKTFTGWYCVGCEAFKTEHELIDGHCELHPSLTPRQLSEENYFFKFSNYQDRLLDYLSQPDVIIPEWRREEAIHFVQAGLQDFSISREKARLSWGVPVPGDDSQVMYVWFDALTSYISTLGWPSNTELFERFWLNAKTLQLAGKDQVRFQSLMWQAMLMSANLKLTDQVFYHGFINSGGQRMSKSLGNIITPSDLTRKYGTDATRYMLLRHVHPVDDADITHEKLDEWYTANLVNGLGNLVARVMKLAEEHLDTPVAVDHVRELDDAFVNRLDVCFDFNGAVDYIFEMIAQSDAVMTEREPFKKVKSNDEGIREEGKADIRLLVEHLARIGTHLFVIMPLTSEIILRAVIENKKPENLFPRLPVSGNYEVF